MLALALLGITAAALAGPGGPLPRWLRYAGSRWRRRLPYPGWVISCCSRPWHRWPTRPGVLLLIFVTGTGVALGRRARGVRLPRRSHTGQAREDGGCPGLA